MSQVQSMRRTLKMARSITAHENHLETDSSSTAQLEQIVELADSLDRALDDLEAQFFTPSDFEGYDHVTPRLQGLLWHALSYTDAGVQTPGDNAKSARASASRATSRAETTLHAIEDEILAPWRDQMEAYPFRTFGELDE
jgi:hypothetical protein